MPFSSLAARPRENHPARPADPLAPPFYPADLLPTMQGLLAAVADLETRYETERERIEQGPGSDEEKECRLAELRAAHECHRSLHETQWADCTISCCAAATNFHLSAFPTTQMQTPRMSDRSRSG